MSRRQRRIHLLAWLVLGPLAIGGVLLALGQRPPAPGSSAPVEASP